ncbi:Bug family tripartite tricarboxylate transporter substrate binding protein [Ancylobacter terrae]|uniref:Bug family tripartite tricarboxylate transporter substrate binding protein n=1 Tax=Ancylobacter sp. sgz301288 TaxID=3342077 RepID=UPI00385E5928
MKKLALGLLAAAAAMLASPLAPAHAAGYEGKVVTVIVPHGPSGPMNQYARMIAPFLAKHLKAKDVRIDNQPGAGTLKGTNLLWNAEPDGLTIAFTSIATPILAQLADSPGVRFDANKFVYLGRVAYEPRQLFVGIPSKITSVADIQKPDRVFVYPAQGTDEDFYTMSMLSDALDFKMKVVTGYEGIADATLAIIKGEADGYMAAVASVQASLKAGDLKPILTISETPLASYPDVPTIMSEVKTPEAREMAKNIIAIQSMNRTFFGPPNMDPAMVEAMRQAVKDTIADPELLAQAAKMGFPLDFIDGATVQERVSGIIAASQTLKPILKAALQSIK